MWPHAMTSCVAIRGNLQPAAGSRQPAAKPQDPNTYRPFTFLGHNTSKSGESLLRTYQL